jgi:class 3 adenylate cyclase/tetratricopeptide (TPR) repeat protein
MSSTQTVTVLFTDMVGSTELASRLSPQEADQVRQAHFSLLRQALAATEGTEVKNLGDGLMAVFGSPSGAVAAAVAMQQAVEQDNHRTAEPLGLRVAMSCGEATVEDDDYFGDPVVEAARVCALCEGGQILVTETVKTLAGRRCPHPFTVLGDRELKGMPDAVTVCEVGWEPIAESTGIPLPDRLAASANIFFGFLGRQQERQRLLEAVKQAAENNHSTILLSGEPGIGKTSLCTEVAREAHDLGIPVLYGRCDEDLVASYQPFAEALSYLVIHAADSQLQDHVGDSGGSLLTLVPALAKRLPDVQPTQSADPDSERVRLFGAVVNLLALASADHGLLLVLDDLHWADKASLQLLRHVAATQHLSKVMILGTYRSSDISAGDPLSDTLASLRREANAERIELVGLEGTEILEMMERVAGHELDQDGVDLAHAVRRETEGNPFFTTEMLRHLAETGLVHQDDTGRWVASDDLYEKGLPQSVREVVGQRVDRLGEDMRKVLSQAAVIGRDFDIDVLAAVAQMDEDALLDIVDRGVEARLLTEVEGVAERVSFAHALTQHTLYEDLGAARRARAHRKVADVLEQMYGAAPESRAAELAHHFLAATKSADAMKALTYCKMAGDQALAQAAPADALGWFVQALDLYPQLPADENLHCDLLIGLGTAQIRIGDPGHRQTLLDAAAIAQAQGDSARLVAAAMANNRTGVSASGQVDSDRVAVLEAALEAVRPGDGTERAHLLAILGCELTYESFAGRAWPIMSEALAMARRLDDPLCFLRVTITVYAHSQTPDTVEDRLVDLAHSVTLADSLGDPKASFNAHYERAIACLQAADRSGFDSHLDAALSLAERVGETFVLWQAKNTEAMRAHVRSDLDRSQREAEGAFALGAEGVPEAMATYAAQLIEIQGVRGSWSELSEMSDLMAAAAAENPGLPILRAVLARTYCDLGRDDEAHSVIDDDIADGFVRFPYDVTWMSSMTFLCEICAHLGREDGAARLYEWLSPWNAQVSTALVTTQGPVAFHLGTMAALLGKDEDADEHFAKAIEIGEKLESPYWIARTQIEWARLDRKVGTTDRAESKLAEALESAQRHEFGALVEQIEAQV